MGESFLSEVMRVGSFVAPARRQEGVSNKILFDAVELATQAPVTCDISPVALDVSSSCPGGCGILSGLDAHFSGALVSSSPQSSQRLIYLWVSSFLRPYKALRGCFCQKIWNCSPSPNKKILLK